MHSFKLSDIVRHNVFSDPEVSTMSAKIWGGTAHRLRWKPESDGHRVMQCELICYRDILTKINSFSSARCLFQKTFDRSTDPCRKMQVKINSMHHSPRFERNCQSWI